MELDKEDIIINTNLNDLEMLKGLAKGMTKDKIVEINFYHTKELEAENKELKEKHRQRKAQAKRLLGNSTQISQAQEEKIKDLQAKLEAIESNKVAEFRTVPYDENKTINDARYLLFAEHGNTRITYGAYKPVLENGETYTVTISKETK